MTAGVWVMWRIFSGGHRVRPDLRTTGDLARFLGGATAGSIVSGAVAFLTSAATGWGDPPVLALALLTSNLCSQLTVVPFFSRLRLHASLARPTERVCQWLVILTLTPLVFLPHDFPSIVFILIPVLTWCALRTAPYEALAQMTVVRPVRDLDDDVRPRAVRERRRPVEPHGRRAGDPAGDLHHRVRDRGGAADARRRRADRERPAGRRRARQGAEHRQRCDRRRHRRHRRARAGHAGQPRRRAAARLHGRGAARQDHRPLPHRRGDRREGRRVRRRAHPRRRRPRRDRPRSDRHEVRAQGRRGADARDVAQPRRRRPRPGDRLRQHVRGHHRAGPRPGEARRGAGDRAAGGRAAARRRPGQGRLRLEREPRAAHPDHQHPRLHRDARGRRVRRARHPPSWTP